MEDQDQSIVIGTAFPGLADSLELKDYEATKDISPKGLCGNNRGCGKF